MSVNSFEFSSAQSHLATASLMIGCIQTAGSFLLSVLRKMELDLICLVNKYELWTPVIFLLMACFAMKAWLPLI